MFDNSIEIYDIYRSRQITPARRSPSPSFRRLRSVISSILIKTGKGVTAAGEKLRCSPGTLNPSCR